MQLLFYHLIKLYSSILLPNLKFITAGLWLYTSVELVLYYYKQLITLTQLGYLCIYLYLEHFWHQVLVSTEQLLLLVTETGLN